MRILKNLMLPTAFLAIFVGGAAVALAQAGNPPPPPPRIDQSQRPDRPPRSQNSASSLSDAVRRVQRETGGQVLGAERVQFDGRDINRVKVMDDRGRVRYMDDDPQRTRQSSSARRDVTPHQTPESDPRARDGNPGRP